MTSYICIVFGHSNQPNHWYNQKVIRNYTSDAVRYGLDQMQKPGTFGFVIIEETKDTWRVLDQHSILPPDGYSVGCKNYNYYIEPAPQLLLK